MKFYIFLGYKILGIFSIYGTEGVQSLTAERKYPRSLRQTEIIETCDKFLETKLTPYEYIRKMYFKFLQIVLK